MTPENLIEQMCKANHKWWDNKITAEHVKEHERKEAVTMLRRVLQAIKDGEIAEIGYVPTMPDGEPSGDIVLKPDFQKFMEGV